MASTRLIPMELTKPKENLDDYSFLIFGRRKIGKTTLLLAEPQDALLFRFEEGAKAIRSRSIGVRSWKHFRKCIAALEEDTRGVKRVVIDTAELCYRFCEIYICDKFGVDDPTQVAHGKAWKRLRWEFHDTMLRIAKIGVGLWFISHETQIEVEPEDDASYTKVIPSLPKQAGEIILDSVDVIAYYRYTKKGGRELVIRGNQKLEAGCRIDGHFKAMRSVPMGDSANEAWHNLKAAFYNRLGKKKLKIRRND